MITHVRKFIFWSICLTIQSIVVLAMGISFHLFLEVGHNSIFLGKLWMWYKDPLL
jgi:hypothetical protein